MLIRIVLSQIVSAWLLIKREEPHPGFRQNRGGVMWLVRNAK